MWTVIVKSRNKQIYREWTLFASKIRFFVRLTIPPGAYQKLEFSPAERVNFLWSIPVYGLYRYLLLSFAVSTAQMIFQSIIDQILQCIGNVNLLSRSYPYWCANLSSLWKEIGLHAIPLNSHNVCLSIGKWRFFQTKF